MKTILIIEDNEEMRENTAEILELANYKVTTAINGRDGIDKARKIKPDLILCDIMMPEIDGYGVLYFINKDPQTAGIPFIFLTAKADQKDIRKGMNLGADDYLTKPFEEMDLLDAIESRFRRNDIVRKEFARDLGWPACLFGRSKGQGSPEQALQRQEIAEVQAQGKHFLRSRISQQPLFRGVRQGQILAHE
jgi:CheY-like chemotaxis protein